VLLATQGHPHRHISGRGAYCGPSKDPGDHPPPNTYTIPNTRARVNAGESQDMAS